LNLFKFIPKIEGAMNASSSYTTLINVQMEFHPEAKRYALTSTDMPGLLLAGSDLPALLADVPAAIKLLYQLNYGMNVEVFPTTRNIPQADVSWISVSNTYVAVPKQQ
jgi:hypothetical protein